jgi:hypothetical protein
MRAFIIVLLALVLGTVGAADVPRHDTHGTQTLPGRFAADMDRAMKRMMDDMHQPGYSGNPDVDFLAMMVAHHEGAVEMARLALVHGRDPLTRRLAEEIIASQTSEIAAMRSRMAILRKGADPDPGGFPALHGTRGDREPEQQ